MSLINASLPLRETDILWRYFDGVSQALALRFEEGSSPGEENLTFLLCELLDQGCTSRHALSYSLAAAKVDLAKSDGGLTLDVSFETHPHTKPFESKYSGADIGIVFKVDHPNLGSYTNAVLLQAKRLAPGSKKSFSLNSSFDNFDFGQRDFLIELEHRFSAPRSIAYLWYAPASTAFAEQEAAKIRANEAHCVRNLGLIRGVFPGRYLELAPATQAYRPDDQVWRSRQPGTRFSELRFVKEVTHPKVLPRLSQLYDARRLGSGYRHNYGAFEPFADLFLLGLASGLIGDSSDAWVKLALGKKVPMPKVASSAGNDRALVEMPEIAPIPRHSIFITLGNSLREQ